MGETPTTYEVSIGDDVITAGACDGLQVPPTVCDFHVIRRSSIHHPGCSWFCNFRVIGALRERPYYRIYPVKTPVKPSFDNVMATWIDVLSLSVTTIVFVGTILAVIYSARKIASIVAATKESLKNRGISLSGSGVSIKTNKRLDMEHYVDATQRGLIKVMDAASFGKRDAAERTSSPASRGGSSSEDNVHAKPASTASGVAVRKSNSK